MQFPVKPGASAAEEIGEPLNFEFVFLLHPAFFHRKSQHTKLLTYDRFDFVLSPFYHRLFPLFALTGH